MITLKDFFEKKELVSIHCKTKEQAEKLLQAFDEYEKTWLSGDSYITSNDCYRIYGKNTVYYNNGTYGHIKDYNNMKTYEFEEVNLKPILEKTCIVYNDSVLTFDGNIKPSNNQNCVIEQGIDEVVDSVLVHTIYVKEN